MINNETISELLDQIGTNAILTEVTGLAVVLVSRDGAIMRYTGSEDELIGPLGGLTELVSSRMSSGHVSDDDEVCDLHGPDCDK